MPHLPFPPLQYSNKQVIHLGSAGWRSVICDQSLAAGTGVHRFCVRLGLPGTADDADYVIGVTSEQRYSTKGGFGGVNPLGFGSEDDPDEHGVQFAGRTFPRRPNMQTGPDGGSPYLAQHPGRLRPERKLTLPNNPGCSESFWPFSTGSEAVVVHLQIDMGSATTGSTPHRDAVRTMTITTAENESRGSPRPPLVFRGIPAPCHVVASVREGGAITIL